MKIPSSLVSPPGSAGDASSLDSLSLDSLSLDMPGSVLLPWRLRLPFRGA